MAQLQMIIGYNYNSDYLGMGKVLSDILRQNMQQHAEAEFEAVIEDSREDEGYDRLIERGVA